MADIFMATEEGNEFLIVANPGDYDSVRLATDADITLEKLAQTLDLDAENCNSHDYVCAHRGLASLLFREVGREHATRIMRRLAGYRGLHGMVDCSASADDFEATEKDLGVQLRNWSSWELRDEDEGAN